MAANCPAWAQLCDDDAHYNTWWCIDKGFVQKLMIFRKEIILNFEPHLPLYGSFLAESEGDRYAMKTILMYLINLACCILAILLGVLMIWVGVHKSNVGMRYAGIFMTLVMSAFALYIFGVSDEQKRINRERYVEWLRGPTSRARVFRWVLAFLAFCAFGQAILQMMRLHFFNH